MIQVHDATLLIDEEDIHKLVEKDAPHWEKYEKQIVEVEFIEGTEGGLLQIKMEFFK